ncbi:Trafficking protein particle complex subunit 10 [Vanrija pseudolonga]|uniref:Trafficking protein particle complex subunit 10 n=1 Tax=Vanrija pseudolonga TaxID=143232 RepID=A0AAF0YDE2_9TREE|nr:Trafficking protein particle complex subunit 10 [Vanrija pseudolonga]
MPPREVLLTYTLYPSGNGDLHRAVEGVIAQFPLRNLHWKSTSRTSLRTIQEVDVRLVDLGDVPPPKEHVSGSVLETPLVNICFVACDDADIYKNNTRSFIRDWLSVLQSRRSSHTPLIVLVNPVTASGVAASTKNVFGRDKGVIAKLKTDFNTKRDICTLLNLPPSGSTDPAAWPELLNKLKESIVLAFDASILEREEEVKRGEAQRLTIGWNFCTWFLLKESLAHSFEGVNLNEDALIIYEELDAAFLQCLKDQNLSWFGKLGGTAENDDSLPILDTNAKPYRDLLISSTISIFDFRIYVFARQCILLGKLGRITEIAKRGQWFVASLARRLLESEASLPKYFVESWTYTACMDIVAHCDEWSKLERPNNDYSGLIAYESARSELLDIARVQVERIGVGAGHLPNRYPFQPTATVTPAVDDVLFEDSAENGDSKESAEPKPRPPLTNRTIIYALESPEAFKALYEDLTRSALSAYEACGKLNSAIRLKVDLAALAEYSQDYESAYTQLRLLARDCIELHVWDRVSKYAIQSALAAHTELQLRRDEDWAQLALALLRVCAVTPESKNASEEELAQLRSVIEGLKELPESRQVLENPVFHLRLLDSVATASSDVSVTQLAVQVNNGLPLPVRVNDVWVDLESETFGEITYSSGPVDLQPGKQTITVTCSTSIAGAVTVRDAFVAVGPVGFVTSFPKGQVVVPVHRNLRGMRAVLRMPSFISLDEEPRVVLEVQSGHQTLKSARVVLASLQSEVAYALDRASSDDRALELSPESIGLGDLEEGSSVSVTIPYTGIPRMELAKAHIVVQYDSPSGRVCSFVEEQNLFLGLPLTVNVQDIFRPDVLVSSFVVASDGHEYLRIRSVNLRSSSGAYDIESCRTSWKDSISTSCLFKVKPKGPKLPTNEVLRLSIDYHTVEEEIEAIAQASLDKLKEPCAPLTRVVRDRITDRSTWLQNYLLANDPKVVFDDNWLVGLPASVPTQVSAAFTATLSPVEAKWRTLQIPVEVPLRRLLTTVTLKPAQSLPAIYEGRALPFDLSLATSLSWIGESEGEAKKERTYRVTFDIQANADDWVVVGKKRGVYTVNPDEPERQGVILVPVRSGNIALPPVNVQLVADASEASERVLCETYVSNAAQGIRILPARTGMAALVPISNDWEQR